MGDIEISIVGGNYVLKQPESNAPSPLIRRRTIIRPSKKAKPFKLILDIQ